MNGIELIAAERKRQIDKEGWTAERDEQHKKGELSLVAALYATPVRLHLVRLDNSELGSSLIWYDPWPWAKEWDKRRKHSRKRRLAIAGALIAAELDRIA